MSFAFRTVYVWLILGRITDLKHHSYACITAHEYCLFASLLRWTPPGVHAVTKQRLTFPEGTMQGINQAVAKWADIASSSSQWNLNPLPYVVCVCVGGGWALTSSCCLRMCIKKPWNLMKHFARWIVKSGLFDQQSLGSVVGSYLMLAVWMCSEWVWVHSIQKGELLYGTVKILPLCFPVEKEGYSEGNI